VSEDAQAPAARPAIAFEHVDIVFGQSPGRALALVDAGRSRDEILKETGSILGVADASLAVAQGEICVLMGLSGSGKSTLLRAVNQLNKVSRGRVLVEHDGAQVDVGVCDAETLRAVRSRSVAMVFQQFGLLPWRSVRDNVGFGLELRGMGKAERAVVVDEKLAMVGLSQWAEKAVGELSGGMQQRVGLARAFATDAQILLMDEPFSALDPLIRTKLQDELLDLQRRLKKTILFVSHDLDEALKIGNRIAIMEGGRIVQCGSAEDIVLKPANAYVGEFVAHMNPMHVLSAAAVMQRADTLAWRGPDILLDRMGILRLSLDEQGRPAHAFFGERPLRLVHGEAGPDTLTIAPSAIKLREAIALRRASQYPLALVDRNMVFAGLCGETEIYRGLLRDL
jgi:glycine betaine/proline transport system ATP-binding protein